MRPETKRAARWLHDLGRRLPDATDQQHIAHLLGKVTDEAFLLYLDAIREDLGTGVPYGSAIVRYMSVYIPPGVQERIKSVPTSRDVDTVLTDAAFEMVEQVSEHQQVQSMLDRAGCAYSQHRDWRRGVGPYDLDVFASITELAANGQLTSRAVNLSFTFANDGRLESIRAYSSEIAGNG